MILNLLSQKVPSLYAFLIRLYLLSGLRRLRYWKARRGKPRLNYVDDLKAEATSRGWSYKSVLPMTVQVSVPSKTIVEDALEIVQHAQRLVRSHFRAAEGLERVSSLWYASLLSVTRYPVYETFTCEIPDAFVGVPRGEVISSRFDAVTQSSRLDWSIVIMDQVGDDSSRLSGTHVSLLGLFGYNYCHWLVDILPRLALIQGRLGDFLYVLPKRDLPRYKLESLELLGISPQQLVPLGPGWHRLERVLICHHAQRILIPRKEHLLGLRNMLVKAVFGEEDRAAPWRRVYVSRNKSQRKILNEDEILPVLREYGFERHFCEELGFRDQVRLFAESKFILGPHGAGMENQILCEPGAKMIELLNPVRWNYDARVIANVMGHEHWYSFGKNANGRFDMTVDPKKLGKLLAYVFNQGDILEAEY